MGEFKGAPRTSRVEKGEEGSTVEVFLSSNKVSLIPENNSHGRKGTIRLLVRDDKSCKSSSSKNNDAYDSANCSASSGSNTSKESLLVKLSICGK